MNIQEVNTDKELSEIICDIIGFSSLEHFNISSKIPSGKRTNIVKRFSIEIKTVFECLKHSLPIKLSIATV